ncbi:Transporter substrate-binding domain-containing protein [Rubrivivax sp. A210]|uniref:substrate-binding periplasmic protein n=1 Tax=Rubrivivax sp. A210 TaxID=2772301 RepID=UPI001992C03D|nr:transporter substrate-binding domain-containing protein [Rubrivivax sp. A210]CAD5373895.1 Transporter substrate-binding domain-containing protein [Rubrivivax sp. A210]
MSRACDGSRRRWLAAAALGCAGVGAASAQEELSALARVKRRGRLSVGLYQAMPPFHADGKGIDVELARALAAKLGVEFSPLAFPAGENMDDDLRNMVWRGHYLGYGPADVLLHVPVDRPLMAANPRVQIFGPYYREQVMLARDRSKLPDLPSLEALGQGAVAVPGLSLAGWLLLGADGGRYRDQLKTRWKDGAEAAAALQRGEVVAAAGQGSELESVLGRDERFVIEPLPLPQARNGWVVGMAVKKDATDLAHALQGALNELAAAGSLKEMFAKGGVRWRTP